MSKSSKKNSKNFEQLYYTLKEEYDQMQKDNNEIFKEYESTIQMLTDSIKELQNQRNSFTKKISELEKEKENLKNKNNDKIIDIQELNKQNEKLIQEINKIKEDKKSKDTKIVILENDSEYFQKLIRQNEAIIDELNYKLEEVLEENITIQTEYEIYKQIMNEQIMRKEDELKEIKNDMYSKDLMIKKLKNKKGDKNSANDKIYHFKYKAGKATNNKDKSKINNSYNYSRDNNLSFSFFKENVLFRQIALNSNKKNDITCHISSNKKSVIPLLSLLSSIKRSAKKYKFKMSHPYSKKNPDKNNSDSLKTPSKNKIIKVSNNNNNYSSKYTFKNNFQDLYELKQINKFVIDNNNCDDDDYLRNDDTTVAFTVFKNRNDDNNVSFSNENDYPSNFDSNKKSNNDNIIICKKKKIDVQPFRDVFLKKLRNSKKMSNNMEKLMDVKHRKGKKIVGCQRWNQKKEKIGYKIK